MQHAHHQTCIESRPAIDGNHSVTPFLPVESTEFIIHQLSYDMQF